MLKSLYIKNFTLIDVLNVQFFPGFSVITGETGAGKSIILGALGLLLGQRADSKTVKQGADKCVVEAHFDLTRYQMRPFFDENDIEFDAQDCIIRRELTAQGKSRAFINDSPVALALLKELGERLVDIHSQHQNLLLGKHDFQLDVVDTIADDAKALARYQQAFAHYQQQLHQLQQLQEEIARNQQNLDFLQFQHDELEQAHLNDGEQEELEQKSDTMTHSEDIKAALYAADHALSDEETGVVRQLKTAIGQLQSVGHVLPLAAELSQRLDSSYIELKDAAQDIGSQLEDIDFDPAELDAVNARLDKIYDLEKKYHVESIGELLALQADLARKLEAITGGDEALGDLRAAVDAAHGQCQQQADALTVLRRKAAEGIEQQMQQRLVPLGMPNVRFHITIEPQPLSRSGQDKVQFLFSANRSTPLQPVAQVASGGEIARVMLSLKAMISGAVKLPTIIFDEIDTGVSGKIAEQMARIMAEMGEADRQVISITHLPQIAALGTHHYRVEKQETETGTSSQMRLLTADERIQEVAQMLSGSSVTEAAIENAKQLLKI